MVSRIDPRDSYETSDPICPVCLEPIASGDLVSGRHDDLMHEQCDYMRKRPPSTK